MDKRFELIDALLNLSQQASRVAKLLAEEIIQIPDERLLLTLPSSTAFIDIATYRDWPTVPTADLRQLAVQTELVLEDCTVLEYSLGPTYPVTPYQPLTQVDLLTSAYKFPQGLPAHIRLLSQLSDITAHYDLGICWESLEFTPEPAVVLTTLKQHCRQLRLRLRPWTSPDGGFTAHYFNRAYAQLVMPWDTLVKFMVVRPLATYEDLFKKCGWMVVERHVSGQPATFLLEHPEILNVIIERTWGQLDPATALNILATHHVDYLLC